MIDRRIVVDLFAGGGGASLGIRWALGRDPDVAVDHSSDAVAMHEANHPCTRHLLGDVWDYAPREVSGGRPVELLWASPTCTHFSKAKGGPLDRREASRIRALAWVVTRWAREVKPTVITMENVEAFATWGPLTNEGKPCERRRGLTFRRWVRSLEAEGYAVEWRELRACDYGAPTTRKRLFVVARCDGMPITWPTPTHGPGRLPFRTAAECIDWSVPCPSIAGRSLSAATVARIQRGVQKFVVDAPEPYVMDAFIAKHYGGPNGRGTPGSDLRSPLSTITTRDHNALVTVRGRPVVDVGMRSLTPRELFTAQGFPAEWIIDPVHNGKPITKTTQIRLVGNSVPPQLAAAIVGANVAGGARWQGAAA